MEKFILSIIIVVFATVFLTCSFQTKFIKKEKIEELSLIPIPTKITKDKGNFSITPELKIYLNSKDEQSQVVADYLVDKLNKPTGFNLKAEKLPELDLQKNIILLTTNKADKNFGDEGYTMTVDTNFVIIRANKAAGLFYGVQTLRQLLPVEIESSTAVPDIKWQIPCVEITDGFNSA